MIQEEESILAQPLAVTQSKMYGSHAHAIPKTKGKWTTFIAEMKKANHLEGLGETLFICLSVQHEEVEREIWLSHLM
jgi:hypothetical protein